MASSIMRDEARKWRSDARNAIEGWTNLPPAIVLNCICPYVSTPPLRVFIQLRFTDATKRKTHTYWAELFARGPHGVKWCLSKEDTQDWVLQTAGPQGYRDATIIITHPFESFSKYGFAKCGYTAARIVYTGKVKSKQRVAAIDE